MKITVEAKWVKQAPGRADLLTTSGAFLGTIFYVPPDSWFARAGEECIGGKFDNMAAAKAAVLRALRGKS